MRTTEQLRRCGPIDLVGFYQPRLDSKWGVEAQWSSTVT